MGNPFTDAAAVGGLYVDPARLTQRTTALHQAKIAGPNVADTIVTLLARHVGPEAVIADVGCGAGRRHCASLPTCRCAG